MTYNETLTPITNELAFSNTNPHTLFELFEALINPLKYLESLISQKMNLEENLNKTLKNKRISILATLIMAIGHTFLFSIPFLIVFYIATNLIHVNDGQTLLSFYDAWAGKISFVKSFFNFIHSIGYKGAIASIIQVITMFAFYFVIVPCVTVLCPISLLANTIISIVTMIKAKKDEPNIRKQLDDLESKIIDMKNNLSVALKYVPKDYRYSTALEHFCNSYANGRADNLKEAIEALNTDIYRQTMVLSQETLIEKQVEVLKEIKYQGQQLESIKKSVHSIKDKVEWDF